MSYPATSQAATKVLSTTYDRASCEIGIVHLGYGAFHRAHQAVYFDDYMERTGDLNWGIAAINLRGSESQAFADAQRAGEGYLLKTTAPDGETGLRMVRPHLEFADWSRNAGAAEGLIACATVHAVTITVTESGYYLDDAGALNIVDPTIAAEIAGGPPKTVYGFLSRALAQRAGELDQPLSILCCDNIRANGRMLERNVLAYLEHSNETDLAAWVRAKVTFPSSMVDRITPRAGDRLATEIGALFPDQVLSPIHAEDYAQWVLEDRFAGPMADLAAVGVEVVPDVDPFEEAKIRILNGGHTGLTYLGALAGYETFDQAMADVELRAHFDGWLSEEVLPGLTLSLPFDKQAYRDQVAARFANQAIADSLERICMDGYAKHPLFIRPTLESCLEQGIVPRFGFDCIASWYVYARRVAAGTMRVPYHEPNWDSLVPLLAAGEEETFARLQRLWASLPDAHSAFVPGVIDAIAKMETRWPASP